MTRYQLLLLPTLAAALLVLGGALGRKQSPAPPPVAGSEANDPEAVVVLDRALAALAPDQLQWAQAQVWQQAHCEDFTYQASGRLVLAPGDRSRFDLNVQVGGTLAELGLVCDGRPLWRSVRFRGEPPTVWDGDLPGVVPYAPPAEDVTRARARFLQAQGFRHPSALLADLRRGMKSARVATRRWNGREV